MRLSVEQLLALTVRLEEHLQDKLAQGVLTDPDDDQSPHYGNPGNANSNMACLGRKLIERGFEGVRVVGVWYEQGRVGADGQFVGNGQTPHVIVVETDGQLCTRGQTTSYEDIQTHCNRSLGNGQQFREHILFDQQAWDRKDPAYGWVEEIIGMLVDSTALEQSAKATPVAVRARPRM